jgi:uncharacterized protein with NRDE domain
VCLALIAFAAHRRYRLVIAANRDEFHSRAAVPASWITPDILAGRDLQAGGTWLGLRRDGCCALLTNFRDPGRNDPRAPSRGSLPLRVLEDKRGLDAAMQDIAPEAGAYNGFSLLACDASGLRYLSNRGGDLCAVPPGVHGLSNHLLDTPWPKVVHSKARLQAWIAADSDDVEPLFSLLADRRVAPDEVLPSTGVALEWERLLSPPFIVSERYGTRCSTVILIDREGHALFIERSFDSNARALPEVRAAFALASAA